jgi:hypothetical protein
MNEEILYIITFIFNYSAKFAGLSNEDEFTIDDFYGLPGVTEFKKFGYDWEFKFGYKSTEDNLQTVGKSYPQCNDDPYKMFIYKVLEFVFVIDRTKFFSTKEYV